MVEYTAEVVVQPMCPAEIRFECVEEPVAAVLREKTPAERISIADDMWRFARDAIITVLGQAHPEWCDRRILEETARRLYHGSL